jgi:hypothetical protein
MDAATRAVQQLTGELGHADYEPAYLPNGDIIFNSTRCVQIVDCWWTEVSNLYTCSGDGRYLRRLSFDQVHTNYPCVTPDGRVLYTRWEYSDRGQIYPQALFEMLPDGTAQQEYYGNSSWFPTAILHARSIPGTSKVLAVISGHHTLQAGKLGVIDIARGRQESEGVQLVAPIRKTRAVRVDRYGQEGDIFKYPYPIDEHHFLVSYAPLGWEDGHYEARMSRPAFGLYFMDLDGHRELLYLDTEKSRPVGRMVPLASRSLPFVRPSSVDHRKDSGVYYIQDIYAGEGLPGVPPGTVKALRVVALDFRAAGMGSNSNEGEAGGALISTPIAIGNGAWDVKIPLGEVPVHEDGSAFFTVPARTPVYFQALDERGHAIQSMRSWTTLQPGESRSCVGCHDKKNMAPPAGMSTYTMAMRAGPHVLNAADATGFSFSRQVQPILDRHCISCHRVAHSSESEPEPEPGPEAPFSLEGTPQQDVQAKRLWSTAYVNLTQGGPHTGPVHWISAQSAPPVQAPYSTGAATSPLVSLLAAGHYDVALSPEEQAAITTWIDLAVPFCGDYTEAAIWTEEEQAYYARFLRKRADMQAREAANIRDYLREHP